MKNKKNILMILGLVLIVFALGNIYAVCCEETVDGASCLNVEDISECKTSAQGFRSDSTSCEATTYCSVGTCIDNQEGLCFDAPQTTCNAEDGGFWVDEYQENVAQCQEGCCILGEQTAFVTPTRCTYLAAQRGADVTPDFLSNIQNSESCNALANPSEKGACVYDSELGRKCTMETREECQVNNREFHAGLLCSAEQLGTLCGPSERTSCVEGKEEVYFYDSCGNVANIYDSTKAEDQNYWTYIQEWEDSCNLDINDPSSVKSCGNCGYSTESSVCGAYRRGEDASPNVGDYVCRDLGCDYEGQDYSHGESWCANPSNWEDDVPGREEIRLICSNGEVTSDPCDSFRNSICREETLYDDGTSDGYLNAGCVVNEWSLCVAQNNQDDCELIDYDCEWLEEKTYELFNEEEGGVCVPKYAPGLNFWDESSDTFTTCQALTTTCNVKFEKKAFGSWKVKGDKTCLEDGAGDVDIRQDWAGDLQNWCTALGDCGVKTNYINVDGKNFWEELFTGDVKKSSIPNGKSHGGGISAWWEALER